MTAPEPAPEPAAPREPAPQGAPVYVTDPSQVSPLATLPPGGLDLKSHLADIELELIKQALEEADGVVAHAAPKLGLRRTTLVEKLRKYGIDR